MTARVRSSMERRLNVASHEDDSMAEVMAAPLAVQLEKFAEWGLPRAGLLILMSACQGRCFFCASPAVTAPGPDIVTPRERALAWLDGNRSLAVEDLCLGGTEPPTHSHFRETLERARDVGFARVQLMTSALPLANEGVAREWHALGIRSVATPLYAASAALHDEIVGVPGHFERVLAGLDRAFSEGITPHVHTLAIRRNLAELGRLAELSLGRWHARLSVAPLRAKEEVFSFASEASSYAELERALAGAPLSLIGFPSCVAPNLPRGAALLIQLYFRAQRTELDAVCASCRLRAECPGLVLAHHASYGAEGLRPS